MPRCEMCDEWPGCPWKTDPEIICGEYHPKPITNADRIRAMSDEELAELFESWIQDCGCNAVPCLGACKENIKNYGDKSCQECWLDWLKRVADT